MLNPNLFASRPPDLTAAPSSINVVDIPPTPSIPFALPAETFCAFDLHREVWVWATFTLGETETLLDYGESVSPRGHRRLPLKWLIALGYTPRYFESFAPTLTQYASDQLY